MIALIGWGIEIGATGKKKIEDVRVARESAEVDEVEAGMENFGLPWKFLKNVGNNFNGAVGTGIVERKIS